VPRAEQAARYGARPAAARRGGCRGATRASRGAALMREKRPASRPKTQSNPRKSRFWLE